MSEKKNSPEKKSKEIGPMDFPTDATGRVVVVGVLKAFAISIISRAGVHKGSRVDHSVPYWTTTG